MNVRLLLLLAVGYGTLLVYASLYPFSGWRADGLAAFGFLTHGWPPVAPRIDNYVNVLAYLPLGLLFALCLQNRVSFPMRVVLATTAALSLSFSMEFLQQYLPRRIASPADLATNTCGALFGALLSSLFDRERLPGRLLACWREQWVKPGRQHSLGLAVLAAWALSQWLPGLPSFSVDSLRAGLAPLWHTTLDLSSFDLLQWGRYSLYLSGLALLAKTLANPGRSAVAAFFIFVAVVFAYKVSVVGRQLSLEAAAGALCAMLLTVLWLAHRVRTVASVAAFMILGGFICAHVLPGQGSAQHLSNWAPLLGPIDHPMLGLGSVLEILWPAAALGYLTRIAAPPEFHRMTAWAGGAALAFLILVMDWPQRSVPIATALLMGAAWTFFGRAFTNSTATRASQPETVATRISSPSMQ